MYVGVTETPEYRFNGHFNSKSPVGLWIKKMIKQKRRHIIWLSKSPMEYDRALDLELKMIKYYKSIGQAEFNNNPKTNEPPQCDDSGF